jgi:hypothetical protein
MANKVLLVTSVMWATPARLAAAFADCGWQVDVLAPPGHAAGKSPHLNTFHTYRPWGPQFILQRAIEAAEPDLIVPCDERALRQLLALRAITAETAGTLARSLGEPRAYPILLSRSQSLEAARALGIAVPLTIAVSNPQALEQAVAETGFPAAIKLDGSWGGDGIVIANDAAEARAAFRKLSHLASPLSKAARALRRRDAGYWWDILQPGPTGICVQRAVTGRNATCSVAAWKGDVMGALCADVVATRDAFGPSSVLRIVDAPEMIDAACEIAAKFGLSGLHGLDFIRADDGSLYLIEIAPYATQSAHLALGPERDLIAALTRAATGNSCPARPAVTDQDLIALFPQEWLRDAQSPYLHQAYHDAPWEDAAVLDAVVAGAEAAAPFPRDTAPVLILDESEQEKPAQ